MTQERFIARMEALGFAHAQDYPGQIWLENYLKGKGLMVGIITEEDNTTITLDAIDDNTGEAFDSDFTSFGAAWNSIKRYFNIHKSSVI